MARTSTERKESLVEERTAQILEAAARLFATQGYHKTTTKQIAAEAGVAEGTIYNYFAGKEDLLVGMLNRLAEMDTLVAEIEDASKDDQRTALEAILAERLSVVERNLHVVQAVLPQVLADVELRDVMINRFAGPAIGVLQRYFEAEIEAGRLRPANPALHARLVQAMFIGILLMATSGESTVKEMREQIPAAVAEMILYGLVPRPEASS